MKQLALFILLSIGFSSCTTTYYYSTVSHNSDQIYQVDNGDFVNENDSVLVSYSFNGNEGPVKISIFNKSDKPLYVNWQESSLIIDSEAVPYFNGKTTFEGESYGASVQVKDGPHSPVSVGESMSQFSGSVSTPQNTSYIPPQTKVSYNSLRLNPYHILKIDKKEYTQVDIDINKRFPISVKVINFENDNSPLPFRSYLSMCFSQSQPFYMNDDFYISQIMKTSKSLPLNRSGRGNVFCIEDTNSTGAYIAGGAVLGGILIYGIVEGDSIDKDFK